MKEIKLSRGQVALVDDEDFERLNAWKWCAAKRSHLYYAQRTEYNPLRRFVMQNEIIPPPPGFLVDHKDGNSLNNTRKNLRLATILQNARNRGPRRGNAYKGITRRGDKWEASIGSNNRTISLGVFLSAETAALAYDYMAREMYGEFARLNFPDRNGLMPQRYRKKLTSQYRGVYAYGSKWRAEIGHNGRQYWLGDFPSEIAAARAYDTKALELLDTRAKLNFPHDVHQ